MSTFRAYGAGVTYSTQLMDDCSTIVADINRAMMVEWQNIQLTIDVGPLLGPGRTEWQRCKRKTITTRRKGEGRGYREDPWA